jgi:two-component system, cell cycle response regulator
MNDMDVDTLTGVGSKEWFERIVARTCETIDPRLAPFSLVVVDLDGLSDFSARASVEAAECELVRVARVLHMQLRADDQLGRIGDDEFGVLLPNADASLAADIAERFRLSASNGLPPPMGVTVSVGFVTAWSPTTAKTLLESASRALDEAKSSGRNLVAMYRPPTED